MRLEPFSALYFLKQNKAKYILLMFMIFLWVGGYLGELYISNPMDNWRSYLQYFHPKALTGLILCNVMVLLPLIVTRWRQLLRADNCEY